MKNTLALTILLAGFAAVASATDLGAPSGATGDGGATQGQAFKDVDANSDGVITKQEAEIQHLLFSSLDKIGDGKVDQAEFSHYQTSRKHGTGAAPGACQDTVIEEGVGPGVHEKPNSGGNAPGPDGGRDPVRCARRRINDKARKMLNQGESALSL